MERIRVKQALLLCSLALGSLAHGATCPIDQKKDDATLTQIEHTWVQTIEQHDAAALDCILADEFEEADFAGALINRAAMLKSVNKRSNVHCELPELHARLYGDFAYVRGVGVCGSNNGQPPVKSRFTDIFVHREGRWQCVAGHESHFPDATK
jgi:ketosteroid isomerase-like protein